MNEYAHMVSGERDACDPFGFIAGWFRRGTDNPYVLARRALRDAFTELMRDVHAIDAKIAGLYENFFVHVDCGRDPRIEHFNGAVRWYKQNRDEMHATITELLNLHASADGAPGEFLAAWAHMPEKIRQSRRRWEQKYTPDNIAERNVVAAFTMPAPRGRYTALDAETDVE